MKRLTTTFSLTILTLLLTLNTATAANRLHCSYSTKDGEGGCFFKDMQLYNQRLVSDMHCAPTSAAMGLSALTFGGVSYYTSSWTKNNFVNKSEIQRINAFGSYMNTSSSNGTTGSNVKKFANREADFPEASKNVDNAGSNKINDAHVRSMVRRNEVDILTYGHYKETCTGVGSNQVCEYKRNGGHVVALNGYYYTTSSSYTVHTYDPWGAVEKHRNLTYLPDYTYKKFLGIFGMDNRPYKSKTHYVYRSGDRVKIIDHINGINSN